MKRASLTGRLHAPRAARRDGDRHDDRARRLRDPRHVDEAVQQHRRPRQRDAARAHRDGHRSRASCARRSATPRPSPALVSGTDDAVKFHVDLSDGSRSIEQHEIAFNPTARHAGREGLARPGLAADVPDADRQPAAAERVARRGRTRPSPLRSSGTTPTTSRRRRRAEPVRLTTPLSATDLARVAKIEINFMALPPGTKPTLPPARSTLQNEVYVRVADPNDPAPTPTCA